MLKVGFGEAFVLMNLHFALWWVWRDRNNSIFNPDDAWSTLQIPPYGHIMKINCDASLFNDYPYAGFGCVIRDSNRVWIKGCLGTIHSSSVLRAELFAQPRSNLRHSADADLVNKILEALNWNWNAQVVLIQRTANTAADFLAKYAVERNIAHMELLRPLNNM
ncbi:hypothetical protein PIB30_080974 [Stylosanthes scabra]|uniref:RNase H type-1 domain-containing protein n=1 Tax=Stylosanthes scabra TaxID=79078 RepID=A0ABU6WRB8_9FABA|nr:hypothetical protein [Stylosanthes scabra]